MAAGAPKRFSYGSTPIEGFDLYATTKPNAPVQVFVHGGAWRAGLARDYATPAEMFVNAGAHFAVLDFNNVIETKGDLMTMAKQVRSAVAWICKNAASFGGDPNRVFVSGHSSGGHLAGVVLVVRHKIDVAEMTVASLLAVTIALAGLTAAVKDLYAIAGEKTGGGNPDWLAHAQTATKHAAAVEKILAAGATIIGKTITDEVSLGILGENAFDGTPVNVRAPGRVPGGSSI